MYIKLIICLYLLCFYSLANVKAQNFSNHNKIWTFGLRAGLDFTPGSPTPFISGYPNIFTAPEGTASVSDSSGHLLFYTNGKKVYNRSHLVMPSGADLVPFETWSTSQAAVIMPAIGNPLHYYIFSLESRNAFDTNAGHLAYSIVDMSLAGGYGDVISSSMGITLEDSLSEKMIAITGNNHNIWLLTHRKDTAVFLAYEVTAVGIDTVPVVSSVGSFRGENCYTSGVMKVSPNRRKIVSQSRAVSYGTELYDFNPSTGIVSNCRVLDTTESQYGAEFSPKNTKLYTFQINSNDTSQVFQYDISLTSVAAMKASKTLIATTHDPGDLRLGPNDKIYFVGADDSLA